MFSVRSEAAVTLSSRPPKTALLVARRIMRDVAYGHLRPGDVLGSEREMLERYETGRTSLRESLRLLEFQGIIAIKPGLGGGPMLLDPDPSHLSATFVLLMQLKSAPLRTIVEVRSALEPMTSSLAAQRISPDSLRTLAETITAMKNSAPDDHAFYEADRRFHDVIAQSCGNTLFAYIIASLLGIIEATTTGLDYPIRQHDAILRAHECIYEAIKAGESERAGQLMGTHIAAYVRHTEKTFPELLDRVVQWDRL
jgi:GntR family transcriptional repressor for pyruvate dehydrogenase complex